MSFGMKNAAEIEHMTHMVRIARALTRLVIPAPDR